MENGFVINIPDRTLYLFEREILKDYFFITAGKPKWQTPLGEFVITGKTKDPSWFVPPSIRKEMKEERNDVLLEIPPGSENPPENAGSSSPSKASGVTVRTHRRVSINTGVTVV